MLQHKRTIAGTKPLAILIRFLGAIDLLAVTAVVMPRAWIEVAHASCGLGPLPDGPTIGYLARSASALYALHGVLVLYMSLDVPRYWDMIRVFASLAVFHGFIMFGIDLAEGMPTWWTAVEGPSFAATGAIVLVIQSCMRTERREAQ